MSRLLIALFTLLLLPVAAGVLATLQPAWDAAAWRELLSTPSLSYSLTLSLSSGLFASAAALALAHAVLAVNHGSGHWNRLRTAALPLLATPHLALAIGVALLLAPSGWLMRALSPWLTGFTQPPDWTTVQDPWGLALVLGLVLKETPFLLLALLAALSQVPSERLMLQARSLGYGTIKGWLVCVAPLLQRQIRLPFAAVVAFGVGNVDVALALGPSNPPSFAVLLWQWFADPDLALRSVAAAGCLLLTGVTILAFLVAAGGGRIVRWIWQRYSTSGVRGGRDASLRRAVNATAAVLLGIGLASLLALWLRSLAGAWRFPQFWPRSIDAASWRDALATLGAALPATVGLAVIVALLAVAISLAAAEALRDRPALRSRIAIALFVPLVLPQFAFLFGLQVLLTRLRIEGTLFAMLWTHLLFALPYVFGVIAAAHAALDPRLPTAARTLGATRWRAFATVTLPLLLRASLLAAALGFAVSVALFLPSLFAGAGRFSTLATEAAATMASGSLRSAAVYGSAQALLPLLAFAAAGIAARLLFRERAGVPR